MQISNNYIVVEKLEEKKTDGFQVVEIQDSSTYKGKIKYLPDIPVFIGNIQLCIGNNILFAKYSPDTHDIEDNGEKIKFIKVEDILALID